jgi:hypothetical protein
MRCARASPTLSSRKAQQAAAAQIQTYQAGCQRTWDIASAEADLAYTDQAFPECPTCPHRIEPEGAAGAVPFCTLRPVSTPHPFAGLAGLRAELEE